MASREFRKKAEETINRQIRITAVKALVSIKETRQIDGGRAERKKSQKAYSITAVIY